jgi:hypothetical protein
MMNVQKKSLYLINYQSMKSNGYFSPKDRGSLFLRNSGTYLQTRIATSTFSPPMVMTEQTVTQPKHFEESCFWDFVHHPMFFCLKNNLLETAPLLDLPVTD